MNLEEFLLNNNLVISFQPKVVTPGPGPNPGPTPIPSSGYDTNTSSLLLSGFNNRLDATGEPDLVQLSPLGFPFAYLPPVNGFARGNSCYKWEGAISPPVNGTYIFTGTVKSGGYVIFDKDIKWNIDRESDPGSHNQYNFEFTVDLKKEQLYDIKAELVEQAQEYVFELKWKIPGKTDAELVTSLFCHPPSDWKTRLKTYNPPPVVPINPQPDFSTYVTPDLPSNITIFPADNAWNLKITDFPVDKNSDVIIGALGDAHLHPGFGKGLNGIPFEIIPPGTPKVSVKFEIADESDVGPYPITLKPVLENGGDINAGDVHWLGVSIEEKKLYEIYQLQKVNGQWVGYSGAIFDLTTNDLRPSGWTSSDAAGLPVMPGLVKFQEVASGKINHALRFTVGKTRASFVKPATHFASTSNDISLPPMGCRFRLKSSVDISTFPESVKPILQSLKDYGMFVADNGSPGFMFLIGTPDSRWDDSILASLKTIHASSFEVINMGI